MNFFQKFLFRFRLSATATKRFLFNLDHIVQTAGLFAAIVFLLQWLFSLELFFEIIRTSGFSIGQYIQFFAEAFVRVFTEIDDLTPISFIGIAFFQAVALRMLIALGKKGIRGAGSSTRSMVVGLIGSGCVACGGSVISPLLALVASSISISLAEAIGDVLLVFSLLLSFWSWMTVAPRYLAAKAPGAVDA